jgi:hypothetical protein
VNDESALDELFQSYRAACPEIEPGINFMPAVWQKIELRHSFWFAFQRLARTATTGCAALCVILVILNFTSTPQSARATATYTDALLADHSAEKTYDTEAIPTVPLGNDLQGARPR